MVKKIYKKKSKDDGAEDIIEEVMNITGSPSSPNKFGKSESCNESSSSDCVSSPSKSEKSVDKQLDDAIEVIEISEECLHERDASPASPTKAKRSSSPPSPAPAKKAKRGQSPATLPEAKKTERDQSPASPNKAKKIKRDGSPSSIKAKKVKKEDTPPDAKKGEKEKTATPTKSKISEKNGTSEKTKKSSLPEMIELKGFPGWKKQLVMRKSGKTAGQVDVYFYAPDGTKLRSKPDVLSYFNKQNIKHNIDLFDFSKRSADGIKGKQEKITSKKLVKESGKSKKETTTKTKEILKQEPESKAKEKKSKLSKDKKAKEEKKMAKEEKVKAKEETEKAMEEEKDKRAKEEKKVTPNEDKKAKKTKEYKKDESVEDFCDKDHNDDIAENGEGKSSGSEDEKEIILERGTKVVVQIKDSKKKRLRK